MPSSSCAVGTPGADCFGMLSSRANHDADEHENGERLHDNGDAMELLGLVVGSGRSRGCWPRWQLHGPGLGTPKKTAIPMRKESTYQHSVKRGATMLCPARGELQGRSGYPGLPARGYVGHSRGVLLTPVRPGGAGSVCTGPVRGAGLPWPHPRGPNRRVPSAPERLCFDAVAMNFRRISYLKMIMLAESNYPKSIHSNSIFNSSRVHSLQLATSPCSSIIPLV